MFKEAIFGGALLKEFRMPPLERIPLLFIYGKEKNTMFHTKANLDCLDSTKGCAHFGIDGAAHWVYRQKENKCVELVKSFLAKKE